MFKSKGTLTGLIYEPKHLRQMFTSIVTCMYVCLCIFICIFITIRDERKKCFKGITMNLYILTHIMVIPICMLGDPS